MINDITEFTLIIGRVNPSKNFIDKSGNIINKSNIEFSNKCHITFIDDQYNQDYVPFLYNWIINIFESEIDTLKVDYIHKHYNLSNLYKVNVDLWCTYIYEEFVKLDIMPVCNLTQIEQIIMNEEINRQCIYDQLKSSYENEFKNYYLNIEIEYCKTDFYNKTIFKWPIIKLCEQLTKFKNFLNFIIYMIYHYKNCNLKDICHFFDNYGDEKFFKLYDLLVS
jgi:hypothetical protein